MIVEQSEQIIAEINHAFIGKEEIVRKVLMTIYAGGHILLEDCPGVGKTTLALAFSRVLGLSNKRIQFTTDTLPSDIIGFTMFNRETNQFEYREGAANCQLLLADEINRTSPKTQSALLEVMEEHTITVDGNTHVLPLPFICIATQNPLEDLHPVTNAQNIIEVQNYLASVKIADPVLSYAIRMCEATREHELVELGVSPRGVSALTKMAKASAILAGRNYVIPEDVQGVFVDVCAHRMILRAQAQVEGVTATEILESVMAQVKPPVAGQRR